MDVFKKWSNQEEWLNKVHATCNGRGNNIINYLDKEVGRPSLGTRWLAFMLIWNSSSMNTWLFIHSYSWKMNFISQFKKWNYLNLIIAVKCTIICIRHCWMPVVWYLWLYLSIDKMLCFSCSLSQATDHAALLNQVYLVIYWANVGRIRMNHTNHS